LRSTFLLARHLLCLENFTSMWCDKYVFFKYVCLR
jgi:hypothetical protein